MDFNWRKKFTELQEKQNRLGTQRAIISRSFIDHAISQAISSERERVIELMEGMKKPKEKWMLGMDVGYNQALSDIITKLKGG